MRSVIAFETEAESTAVLRALQRYDWTIDLGESEEALDDATRWNDLIEEIAPEGALTAQQQALESQIRAEAELERIHGDKSGDVVRAQRAAIDAQTAAIESEQAMLRAHDGASEAEATGAALEGSSPYRRLAAREARLILEQVADEDHEYARVTFQYPIFDRQTQTWGTVHYENRGHHAVIRLRNRRSEHLKVATQRLVEHLVRGEVDPRPTVRLWMATKALGRAVRVAFVRSPHRFRRPIVFQRVRVLEPASSNEAFTGTVVTERSFESVVRARRSDVVVAGVFLTFSIVLLTLTSPLVWDLDKRLHDQTWTDGWLSWASGNITRIGSALFVGVLLPVTQLVLHWRDVRRKPSIVWNIDTPAD